MRLFKNIKKCKTRTWFLVLVMLLFCSTLCYGETVRDYDSAAAVEYAKKHCGDTTEPGAAKADCLEFVRACVEIGGVPSDADRVFHKNTGYTVSGYVDYMVDNGYAERKVLTTRTHATTDGSGRKFQYVHQEDNGGQVAPGDIILYVCENKACSKAYFHASLCAPADTDGTYAGYFRYYAHNKSINNKILCTINCGKCGKPGTLYALHITSKANGYQDYSAVTAGSVKCTAYNKLRLSWSDSENQDGCYIFYKPTAKSFWEKVAVAKGTSHTYTVPKDYYGATQYFRVAPYKVVDGKTYVGKKSDVMTAYTVPAAPSKVTLSLTEYRKVKVSWPKVAGATTYKVEYKPEGSSKWSFLYRGSKCSAVTKNLAAGKKHTFRVTTFTSSKGYQGERPSGKYRSNSIYTLKKMEKPTVKRVDKKTVQLSWKKISGADGYQISKSDSTKKLGDTKRIKSAKTTKYKLSTAKGKKYYYKVRAYKVVNGKYVYGPWSAVKQF